ncbi:golgin subfamily A member 6-like protein 1 [Odontomachus brunneus]|uniref:golgin subfamily A member 6-like protein 1 n=1 Tax=Odontomachus brunneus TaxID=486640 RepID=UPI0013F25370|nr:golgin subfamily A member 6-like protein 1 [Odontomachus brunneus]
MDVKSKNGMWGIIVKDLLSISKRHEEISKRLEENVMDQKEYLQALFNQLLLPSSVPIVTKTPKISRKKVLERIETIPEDEVLEQKNVEDIVQTFPEKEKDSDKVVRRTRRIASLKAVDNITKQIQDLHNTRPAKFNNENVSFSVKKGKRESKLKRKKSAQNSSDEDENKVRSKYSKVEVDKENKEEPEKRIIRKMTEQPLQSNKEIIEKTKEQNSSEKLPCFSKSESEECQEKEVKKESDAIISPTTDVIEESIYEDAIGKPTPIMNSTLKYSSVMTEKMLNATVVLESLPPQRILNQTVVIQKESSQLNSRENSKGSLKKAQQDSTRLIKESVGQNIYNGLITDDESSPELKKSKKQITKKQKKHILSVSEDDEVPNTPVKNVKENFKDPITPLVKLSQIKTMYKSNALFSPYVKESVKKRVEAFEQQVVTQSPKSVDVNEPTRITRTKTRAMAAAEAATETKNTDKNYTQILARKSLAKAKKIACFAEKQKKDNEESKENKEQMPERINKLTKYDRLNAMPQLKTTPLNKPKLVTPMSATRLQTPSSTQNLVNHGKALTASRANIVITMESFVQVPKTASKNNSADKLEDKRRHEEDAMKKRKEALKLLTEEKRRKREEKELKNKLAREAKEKQELEKRQKAEKEREERAKLAQLMQEKQREEMEKKRLAQLQRTQEKEERRKLEEHQRLQKLLEQEEAERLLAEQKRREQEAERRKEMEVRVQQQAEAIRLKNMAQTAQVKHKQAGNKQQGTTNYVLDSEPDDDESDDENRPKHEIPHWAQTHVRKVQLAMQRHIPNEIVYKFFDTRKCTPDLTELFQGIDRNRLKRTSSAIWKTPPRFSMMEGE